MKLYTATGATGKIDVLSDFKAVAMFDTVVLFKGFVVAKLIAQVEQ